MVEFLDRDSGFERITEYASKKEPFLFIISYDKTQIFAQKLSELSGEIAYSFNCEARVDLGKKANLVKYPVDFKTYANSFRQVIEEIKSGNTYLLNLTFRSKIETSLSFSEIFAQANAPYKLLIDDKFVCFSPECFVKIEDNTISTYPMKGTIDASVTNAKEQILNNIKETAEHTMIVDLMRNDLNMVAIKTAVPKFRYIDKIKAGDKELLQVSSEIKAQLSDNWHKNLGRILDKLTPAGSISGTPKQSTLKIIDRVESFSRGLYCGVFGVYDGKSLKSAVMIRAIVKEGNKLYYHSGGGITLDSNLEMEYQELLDKIYLPI